jgi:hypothetical protein
LSRRGDYLAVQAIVAEKGCAAVAAFVNVRTGMPVEEVVLDHATSYRFDAKPIRFRGTSLVVRQIERLSLRAGSLDPTGQPMRRWPFAIVHAGDARGRPHVFVFDELPDLSSIPESAMDDLPEIGSRVRIGDIQGNDDPLRVVRFLAGERLLRLDDADESRFASRLALPSPDEEREQRREGWFMAADSDARSGHFDDAVRDLSRMLSFEADPELYRSESATLEVCKRLEARVRAGLTTEVDAGATWQYGCQIRVVVPAAKK